MDNFNLLFNNFYPSWTLYLMTFNLVELPIQYWKTFNLAELPIQYWKTFNLAEPSTG